MGRPSPVAHAVELRAPRRRDLEALVSLSLACARSRKAWAAAAWTPPDPGVERRLWAWRLGDQRVWVGLAVAGATAVGAIGAWPSPREGRLAHLGGPFVDPEWWGEGIGTRLHDEALERLRRRGFAGAEILVEAGNARARGFVEARAWRAEYEPIRRSPVELIAYRRTA